MSPGDLSQRNLIPEVNNDLTIQDYDKKVWNRPCRDVSRTLEYRLEHPPWERFNSVLGPAN